ncbi:MAG TPA: DUF2938 domain-containing protein [Candidatus Limnocylindrales bacterium]|nr:DUF2938 domain-containing protein [Candidatus Limnocylindrales bacterium]
MNELIELAARGVLMGVAGSAAMDAWGLLLRRGFGIPTLDYALLGRWIGQMPRGRFIHDRIAASAPIPFERPLGWAAHYAIGIGFALLLLTIVGLDWARDPTPGPPLAIGLGTIVAPWLVMQPGMGAGIAGSRTPNPWATRLRNLATHTAFGLGLFVAAVALA